jgi:hypothetical protein
MTEIISTRQQLVNEINQSSTFKLDSEGNLKKAGFLDKVKNFFSSVFNATDYAIRKEAIENKIVDILSNDKEATDITDKNNSNNLKSLSSKLSGKYNNTATLLNLYSKINEFSPDKKKLAKACIDSCQLQTPDSNLSLKVKVDGLKTFINELAKLKPMEQIDKKQLQALNNAIKNNVQKFIKDSMSNSFDLMSSQLSKDIGRQTIIVNNNKFMETNSEDQTKINQKINAFKKAIPNETHQQYLSWLLNQAAQSDMSQLFLNKDFAESDLGLKAPKGFLALNSGGNGLFQLSQSTDLNQIKSDAQKGYPMYDIQVHSEKGKVVGATVKIMSPYCASNIQLGDKISDPVIYGNSVFEVDLSKTEPSIKNVSVSYSIGKPEFYTGKKTEKPAQNTNNVNNLNQRKEIPNVANKFGNDFTSKLNNMLGQSNSKMKNKV